MVSYIYPGRVVTTFQVAELFRIAYTKAATAQTAINGFKKNGLFPTNRDIFVQHNFAPCQPKTSILERMTSK